MIFFSWSVHCFERNHDLIRDPPIPYPSPPVYIILLEFTSQRREVFPSLFPFPNRLIQPTGAIISRGYEKCIPRGVVDGGTVGKGPNFRDFGFTRLGRSFFERGDTRRRGGQEGRFKEERRVYRGARHVSFLLIIIFNPIHCMVQRFALTPTFEIFLEVFCLLEKGPPSWISSRANRCNSLLDLSAKLCILREGGCPLSNSYYSIIIDRLGVKGSFDSSSNESIF